MSPLLHILYFLFFSSFLILYFQTSAADSHESCRNSCGSEGGPEVRFPFGFNATFGSLCSYPGFTLSCSKGGLTTLNLPGSGDYTVEIIDYLRQSISIRDPRNCLPKRFLESFSLSESPFVPEHDRNFTFLNCSKTNSIDFTGPTVRRVACLSNDNFTVIALTPDVYDENTTAASNCTLISKAVSVPVFWPRRSDSETRLLWDMQDCRDCEGRGGTCGIYGGSVELVGCSNAPYNGLPRGAKYGIIIGVGIPGLLCLIGLGCYLGGRLRAYRHGNSQPSTAISPSIAPPHSIVVSGLDGPTIESYPKTLLGDSRRLPKPNDNTCPICLSEYQPKETLRTIPECNHYFHADCIDEWLKMNATCPLCRNSPDSSCVVTPSSSVSVSSSSLSTP